MVSSANGAGTTRRPHAKLNKNKTNLDTGLLLVMKLTQNGRSQRPPAASAPEVSRHPAPRFPSVGAFAPRLPVLRGRQLAVGGLGGSSLEEVAGGRKP